ncbi:MAG TPA: hypothetical protein VEI97_08910, partial [bacterium]|nr:hypothetical protein [bacterium]
PDLRTSAVTGTAIAPVPGLPVMWETTFAVTNDLLFNAEAGGSRVRGLIKVEDAQDADDSSPTGIKPFVLAEGSTVPVAGATLSSTRYQVVEVLVNDFNGNTPPAAATFAFPGTAPVNSPFSIDLDTASPPLASLDPDGLSLFEVDWQNDGTFDDSIMATVPGADFTHTYTTANPNQQYRIRITDAFNPVSGRLSTLYGPFTVNVTTALNPTVGPDGPVNTGQSGSTISFQYDRFMRPVAADSNGNVYVTYRWNGTGLPFSVVRSADGGNTWGTPVTLTGWASSNGGSLAMTANGKLALAAITGGSSGAVGPLGFARLSNSGTNDLVLETQNSIEATAQWRDPVIATSPTDPDKAWVVANLDSPTDDLLTIWTVNSMSGTPAFGNAGTVDPVSDTGNIFDPHAALGSMNSLHITWTAQTTSTMPGLFYRRFDVATSSFPGAEERVSLATQTNTTIHGVLAVGNDGDPVVVYDEQSNTASTSDIYVTRRASGTWTVPAQVTTGTGAQTAPFLSKDSAGRLVVIWRDNRTGTTDADIWGRVLGADLSPLTPEVALVQDAVNTLHPRIVYNAQNNTHVIVYSDSTSPAPAAPLVRRRILSY